MKYAIPGEGELLLETIIPDLNRTLLVGDAAVDGVKECIRALKQKGFSFVLFTGNTRGGAEGITIELGVSWKQAATAIDEQRLMVTLRS